MNEEKTRYGWYSRKQEALWAEACLDTEVVIWLTPDGREVECTDIQRTPFSTNHNFDDFVSLGPVVRYLRSRKPMPISIKNTEFMFEQFGLRKNK